jgi:hypothetical protein
MGEYNHDQVDMFSAIVATSGQKWADATYAEWVDEFVASRAKPFHLYLAWHYPEEYTKAMAYMRIMGRV